MKTCKYLIRSRIKVDFIDIKRVFHGNRFVCSNFRCPKFSSLDLNVEQCNRDNCKYFQPMED